MAKRPSAADRRAEERRRIREENAEERRTIAAEKAEERRTIAAEKAKPAPQPAPAASAAEQSTFLPQSTILIGAVMLGFLVYLAMNGKLLTYWALLTGQQAPAGSTAAKTAASPPATQPPQTVLTNSNAFGSFAGATSDVLSAIEAFGVAP